MTVADLSPAQSILLAVHLASESNISALHSFTPSRPSPFDPELVLRILLTYLPEAVDPHSYTSYISEVASRLYLDVDREDVVVDTSPVRDMSERTAQKRVKKLRLLALDPPNYPSHAPRDLLTRFVCHRARRIDEETGLLNLVPALVEPFLARNEYLRTWYISAMLPLLRLEVEYYPEDASLAIPLGDFEGYEGSQGMELLLRGAQTEQGYEHVSRDIKSLVGPWMYGSTERKRRKVGHGEAVQGEAQRVDSSTRGLAKIELSGVRESDVTGHDWEHMFRWMVASSVDHLGLVARAVEDWDGPGDVDLGGFDRKGISYLDEDVQRKLELQYAQAIFASCYAAQANTQETVRYAHNLLARLAELLDFIPPPDLATSVESLPRIERHAAKLDESQTSADIVPAALLRPEHPLTTPRLATYMLLQMIVYSAYQFAGLGHPLSLVNVSKLLFYATADEQLEVLRTILRGRSKTGAIRKDDSQWESDRAKMLWLWNWGIVDEVDGDQTGAGVLGKVSKETFEDEMLKALVDTGCYELAIKTYISASNSSRVETVIIDKAMEAYGGASNGNRTRGGVKKAHDIITTFRPQFPTSIRFQQASALIAATHALSFYSLKLQHGIPFQPVSIRASQDPLSLISKLLEQNPKSYTKLDDLIDIARNLVSAGLVQDEDHDSTQDEAVVEIPAKEISLRQKDAERRVTFMAVEASLREDDFETSYSYIVNRLTPEAQEQHNKQSSSSSGSRVSNTSLDKDDDISWRAAFLAGRYRPNTSVPPTLRRLEQRTELLSLALLLAPTSSLTEILAAWRRCEEETTTLQLAELQAAKEFDDRADKRLSGGSSAIPRNFATEFTSSQPDLVLNQKRRSEMTGRGDLAGESPLSMFDLTRNAARALSKNAFSNEVRSSGEEGERRVGDDVVGGGAGENDLSSRVTTRKRDYVASAVSGGLASGLGWVLGATPVDRDQQQHG